MYKNLVFFSFLLVPGSFMCMDKSSDRPQKTGERRTKLEQLKKYKQERKLHMQAFDKMLEQQKKESDEILAMVDSIDLNDLESAQAVVNALQEKTGTF